MPKAAVMTEAAEAWHIVGNLAPLIWLTSLAVSALLIAVLTPLFRNFAVAVPTSRSSHKAPTPQWGGLAVVGATLVVASPVLLAPQLLGSHTGADAYLVLVAALLLVVLGTADDTLDLGAVTKLVAQTVAIIVMLSALPDDTRILPFVPEAIERGLLFLGVLWFVNLVNFMDGIDWMMVAEVVPVTAGIALIGALGALPPDALVLCLALNGAMLGFAPFNRPVARLFMGDMGSLPIGLIVAWLLLLVAGSGHLAAAVLLPLYFIGDASITLLRRLHAGERAWEGHRTHFYQRARDNGFTTIEIVGRVFAVNVGLVGLAALSVVAQSPWAGPLAFLSGLCLVAWLMIGFARGRR